MSIAYREAEEEDYRLIEESWIESYRCAHAAGMINMEDWRDVMLAQIRRILARPDVTVRVAYNPEDKGSRSNLYGWMASETNYEVPVRMKKEGKWQETMMVSPHPLIHYVFVKHTYRRMGIARELLRQTGVERGDLFNFTCKTAVVTKLRLKHARWQPLVARHTKKKPEGTKDEANKSKDVEIQ